MSDAPPAAPPDPFSHRARLRRIALALCVPCILYGVVGTGSTLVIWALLQFDPLRIDFYLSLFAMAAPAAFVIRELQAMRGARVGSRMLAIALNVACVAFALLVAIVRRSLLEEPALAGVLVLLVVAPLLNVVVMLREKPRSLHDPAARAAGAAGAP